MQIYNITDDLLTLGAEHSRPGTRLDPAKVTKDLVHTTGNPGASAKANRDYFNASKPSTQRCSAHLIAGFGDIIRCIPCWPWDIEEAWAAYPVNDSTINVEWCEASNQDEFDASWDTAAFTHALVLNTWGWNVRANLWTHNWVTQTYPGQSTHTDPYPYLAKWGKTWAQFCQAVEDYQQFLKGEGYVIKLPPTPTEATVPKAQFNALQARYDGLRAYIQAGLDKYPV